MPIAKGYLSRVVADARRPTHSSSMPHAMNSRKGFDQPLSPVADKASQLSADRVTITQDDTHTLLSEKKHQESAPYIYQEPRNSEVGDVRQFNSLSGISAGRDEQYSSEKKSIDGFAQRVKHDFNGLTDVVAGQEDVLPALTSSKMNAKSTADKIGAAAQASFEHSTDSSGQQQGTQQHPSSIEKIVPMDAKTKAGQYGSEKDCVSEVPLRTMPDVHHTSIRDAVEFEAQEARNVSPEQHPLREHLQQSADDTEALMTHQIPESRTVETVPREHAFGKPFSVNQSEPAVPQVHIGQIDVVVVSEAKSPAKAPNTSASGDFSSRNYLRRL